MLDVPSSYYGGRKSWARGGGGVSNALDVRGVSAGLKNHSRGAPSSAPRFTCVGPAVLIDGSSSPAQRACGVPSTARASVDDRGEVPLHRCRRVASGIVRETWLQRDAEAPAGLAEILRGVPRSRRVLGGVPKRRDRSDESLAPRSE